MIYCFLADGFEEIEALTPVDVLRRAGKDVQTVGITGKYVNGSHNITVTADIVGSELVLSTSIEMIILPGGMPGTTNLEASDVVQAAIDFCVLNDIFVAAICAAPSILGKKGLLKGKNAICFPKFQDYLIGANICNDCKVVACGKIITAIGAGASTQFSLKLVEALSGKDAADKVSFAMKC